MGSFFFIFFGVELRRALTKQQAGTAFIFGLGEPEVDVIRHDAVHAPACCQLSVDGDLDDVALADRIIFSFTFTILSVAIAAFVPKQVTASRTQAVLWRGVSFFFLRFMVRA